MLNHGLYTEKTASWRLRDSCRAIKWQMPRNHSTYVVRLRGICLRIVYS